MYDFIDVGAGSKGGSIRFGREFFGPSGYGVEPVQSKVDKSIAKGYDVRNMPFSDVEDKAKWVIFMHVLEHLSGRDEAIDMITKALTVGENVLITGPYFDSDGYLYDRGLKFCCADWIHHPFLLTRTMMHNIMHSKKVSRVLGERGFMIARWGKVKNSGWKTIVPLSAPRDVLKYDESLGRKQKVPLEEVYQELRVVIGDVSFLDTIETWPW